MRYIGLDLALATVHKAVVIDEQGRDVAPVLSVETSTLSLEQLFHRVREGARSDEASWWAQNKPLWLGFLL